MLDKITTQLKATGKFYLVFLGDSITSAEWIHPNWREVVEYVLKHEVFKQTSDWGLGYRGIRTFNAGFESMHTQDLQEKAKEYVHKLQADLALFMCTRGNDEQAGFSAKKSVDLTLKLIQYLQSQVEHAFFATSVATTNTAYNQAYGDYLEKDLRPVLDTASICFVDVYKYFAGMKLDDLFTLINLEGNAEAGIEPGSLDTLHPGVKGNLFIAKIILEEIFNIPFGVEKYLVDMKNDVMFPRY